jgi:hypothetical protein
MSTENINTKFLPLKFSYDSLPSPTSIRLLNLRPEGEDYGRLDTYELDKAPPFAALSYTWGCPYSDPNYELEDVSETAAFNGKYASARNIPIQCNSASILVTRNSKDAIDNIKRRYNRPGPMFDNTSYLWVDAICINQEDLHERAAQVKIMRRIYSTATRAFIWLGSSLARTKRAFELINLLGEILEEKYDMMKQYDLRLENVYKALDMEVIPPEDWMILRSFLQRTWFQRVWTVQEYCLPRFTTVMCGEYRIPWMALYLVSDMLAHTDWCHQLYQLEHYREWMRVYLAYSSETRSSTGDDQTMDQQNSVLGELLRLQNQGAGYSNELPPGLGPRVTSLMKISLWPSADGNEDQEMDLQLGVQMIRGRAATDLRDAIYALLDGINRRLEKRPEIGPIVPNYEPSNSVELVYTDFIYRAIRADGNLAALSFINDEAFREISGLPSWVPDMSRSSYPKPFDHESWSPFPMSDTHYTPPTLVGQFSLHVQGIRVDRIADRALPYEPLGGDKVLTWLKLAASLDMPYHTKQGPIEVLWRTLLADSLGCGGECPAPSATGSSFALYLFALLLFHKNPAEQRNWSPERIQVYEDALALMFLLKGADPNGVLLSKEEFFDLIHPAFHSDLPAQDQIKKQDQILRRGFAFEPLIEQFNPDRRLFITVEKKYLGLGSKSLQVGDELWIVPRTRTPVVLRRLPNGHFMVVCAAYVHGIMQGEAMLERLDDVEEIVLD